MALNSSPTEATHKIGNQSFEEEWAAIDDFLPDADIAEEEIMDEVRAIRYPEQRKYI